MNGYSHNKTNPFTLFGEGVGSSITLFTIELSLFFWDTIRNILPTIPANSTATNQVLSYYSEIIGLFVIIAIIQNIIVGFVAPKPFVIGYLVGVGVITYFLYISAMSMIPSVIYGMAASFAIAIGSLIIRLHLENKGQRQWSNYP
jgi:hypothetical protein